MVWPLMLHRNHQKHLLLLARVLGLWALLLALLLALLAQTRQRHRRLLVQAQVLPLELALVRVLVKACSAPWLATGRRKDR
jgi:hypothetical protein